MGLGDLFDDIGDAIGSAQDWLERNDPLAGTPFGMRAPVRFRDDGVDIQPLARGETPEPGERIGGPVGGVIQRSSERFFQAYEYAYREFISQPLSTTILMAQRPGSVLSASEWARTWEAANYISPGQAAQLPFAGQSTAEQLSQAVPLLRIGTMLGIGPGDSENVQRAVDSPLLRYAPPGIEGMPGWSDMDPEEQQAFLAELGMPVDPMGGNAFIADLRRQDPGFRYFSGMNDFAARWYADPLTVVSRSASAANRARYTRVRPREGWTDADIESLVNNSRTNQLVDFLTTNRDNPALVNNTDMALRSAMGPRLGAINSVLTSSDEVRDFIRVGLGSRTARERLDAGNTLARQRLEGHRSRISVMENSLAILGPRMPATSQSVVRREIQNLNEAINADEALVGRYNLILEHADELDQLHLSRGQYRAARARTEAQRDYVAGAARDGRNERQFRQRITPPIAREGTEVLVDSGLVKTRLWGIGDAFSLPVTMVRMVKNVKPNGYMEIDGAGAFSAENIAELRGQIARIPGITPGQRQNYLNLYLRTATEGQRREFLDQLGRTAKRNIAVKYGLTPEAGEELWEATRAKRTGVVDNYRQYSAAELPSGLRVDVFQDGSGQILDARPHTVSRLVNNYILDDLDAFDRLVRRNASSFRALRESAGGVRDWTTAAGESLNQYWKFATLLRLGYIPRTIGDDIASQWAALGSAAMAMRVGYGSRNLVTNMAHRVRRGFDEVELGARRQGLEYADSELARLEPELRRLTGASRAEALAAARGVTRAENLLTRAQERLAALGNDVTPARRAAHEQMVTRREQQLRAAQARAARPVPTRRSARLNQIEPQIQQLQAYRELLDRHIADLSSRNEIVRQGTQTVRIGDQEFPAAFGGQRGEYWLNQVSPSQAYDKLFQTNRQMIHANLLRSFDNGARPISAVDDEVAHATAWAHAVNAQIVGDRMQRMLVAGTPERDVVRWLKRDPEGRAYWNRLGVETISTPEDIVARARFEVDEYLPTAEIRQQALTPEGVTPEFLREAMRPIERPTVHMANVGQAGIQGYQAMNRIMQRWYDVAVNLPAKTLSRHPLFNQLYEGHLRTIVNQRTRQGATPRTVEEVERTAETARRLARRDMKRLTFDIAHQSDAAAALRFISPFFSATAESFQRWGRIIAEKPEVLGYAAKFYNAPAYVGHLQTSEGNPIFPDGTYIDPVTGERKLAPKGDRWIVGRLPQWLVDSPVGIAMGAERSSGNFMLSQNSINVVTQGDPWYNPGVGPIVQIPVNEFVRDKPSEAEMARHLGILPFGPNTNANPILRTFQSAAPSTLQNFLRAFDTSDYRYQQVKMQIMQRAVFEHENAGIPMPSAEEISRRARNYWLFTAATSFVQPAATQRRDAYELFRQQYRNLQRENPETADFEFLQRYGSEYFIFAQSMSRHEAGVPATQRAVELSQQYADELAEFPELGALIIGPEGQGPFSPEAYAYQLTTPLEPGGAEAQRRRLTASEAIKENERRLGWARYTGLMNYINSQLISRGLTSLEDEGAADLAAIRTGFVAMFAEPMRDGQANPTYNEAWSEDWFSFDARRYERLIPAMETVARRVLEEEPDRGDMRSLLVYTEGRRMLQAQLDSREFSTLGARANEDLRRGWVSFVNGLVERDTTFGDLHSRYLARDLGIDIDEETLAATREGGA